MKWTRQRKDVLRGVWQLEKGENTLRVIDLAYALDFNRSSVDRILSHLQKVGLVQLTKAAGISYVHCTPDGQAFAMVSCKRVKTRAIPEKYNAPETERTPQQPNRQTRPGLIISEERYLQIMQGVNYRVGNITREVLYGGIPHRELSHSGCGSSLGGE